MKDVTILDHIVLTLVATKSSGSHSLLSVMLLEVLILEVFSTDEPFFKICVDNSSSLWSFPPESDRPLSDLVFAHGEEMTQS